VLLGVPVLLLKGVEFHCDNFSLVAAINKGSSSDKTTKHLIICLWFFTAVFDIRITATHIVGVAHNAADMLSRNQSDKFLATFSHVNTTATSSPLPRVPIKTGLDFSSVQKTVQEDLPSSSEHCSSLT